MCGIAGVITHGLASANGLRSRSFEGDIVAMTDALYRRGPDAGAVFVDAEAGVALGHRRLAIIDLSERGAQPMHSPCGRFVLVFNGEIYNHLALRREIETFGGVEWRGGSDTETLLAGFAHWGVAATLRKCVGMFALALWDRAERRLSLARDRFGEKPLYYGFVGQGGDARMLFGSELKALRAHSGFAPRVDRGALAQYLRFSYVPAPHSIYEDVYKLEPGTILTFGLDDLAEKRRRIESYWSYSTIVREGLADPILDETQGLAELEAALREAVNLQLVADVPIGAFLSGGVDSSTIVALMQAQSTRKVKTFTIGFEESGFDEAPHAAAVARHLQTEHTEYRVTAAETRAIIPELPTIYDEPFADTSQIPTGVVCRLARREVTVALSGDAGDELLAGYNRYLIGPKLWSAISKVPASLRPLVGAAVSAMPRRSWDLLARGPGLAKSLGPFKDKAYKLGPALGATLSADDLYRALVTEWGTGAAPALGAPLSIVALDAMDFAKGVTDPVQRMMLADGLTYLPDDILAKVDRAAMAVSLETRVPLLDHRVAAIAWRLPMSMKIRDGQSKWALRQILYRHVPRELIERPKAGFDIPVGLWLSGPLREWAEELLAEPRLRAEGYIDPAPVRLMWAQHCAGARDWTARLWNVLMFQAWRDAWLR